MNTKPKQEKGRMIAYVSHDVLKSFGGIESMMKFKTICLLAALLVAMGWLSSTASANSLPAIKFEYEGLTVQSKRGPFNAPFRTNFTGFLEFGLSNHQNLDTTLKIFLSGNEQLQYSGTVTGVSGGFDVDTGVITGGTLVFDITNPDTSVDTMTFVVPNGSNFPVQNFGVDGLGAIGSGDYSLTDGAPDGLFGEVNIGGFFAEAPDTFFADFRMFNFNPDPLTGFDGNVSLDITAVIPAPPAVLAGAFLLGLLAIGKKIKSRRRLDSEADQDVTLS